MQSQQLTANLKELGSDISNGSLLALLIIGIILLVLLSIASLYLITSLRRRTVVLKKVDYLIEDITYKSESLNVTVETVNKISNYLLSLDAVSEKGFKSMLKLISENRNYIYSITEKIKADVEKRELKEKKEAKKSVKKSTTKKPISKSTTTKSSTKNQQSKGKTTK